MGESFEGTLGLGGASLGAAGFSPGTASSTPSGGGGGLCPGFSVVSLMRGLTSEGTVFLRPEGKEKTVEESLLRPQASVHYNVIILLHLCIYTPSVQQ